MTDTTRATSDAEFLGMIPELAGYTTPNSLVCIAMSGLESYIPFRLALPAGKRTSDARPFTSEVIGILSGMRDIDRVAIVIYTDETFAMHRGVPRIGFIRAIGERVHQQGFHFAGLFCVAGDGWADCFDDDSPPRGRPLSEIPTPAVELPRADQVEMPDATVAERLGFLELITDLCSGYWPEELSHINTRDPDEVIELCATWQVGELPDALLVLLAELAHSPGRCGELVVRFAFGMPVSDDAVSVLLAGKGRRAPAIARLERGIHLFKRIVALAPRHFAPDALWAIAWLYWARGDVPAAGYIVDRVLDLEPQHALARNLLPRLIEARRPEWRHE